MNIIFIITGAFMISTGLAINQFKLYDLISGYNTMRPQEKAKFNIEKFALLMQNVFVIMGLCIIVGAFLSIWLKVEFMGLIIMLLTMFICLGYLIYKGQMLKK
jgi:hypothetical protein